MTPNATVLSPATPIEVLSWVIRSCRYPTTVVVGSSKEEFLNALATEVQPPLDSRPIEEEASGEENTSKREEISDAKLPNHPILRKTLLQTAVSRHIRIIFTPSATHLRAWLATFSPSTSKVTAPPTSIPATSASPTLLVYGLVFLHQDSSEWSAQGIGESSATLIDAAARHGFQPVVIEPRVDEALSEAWLGSTVPLLKGTAIKDDGSYGGRNVELRNVLGRWFDFEQGHWEHGFT